MALTADQYYQQILNAKKQASASGFDKLSQAQKNAVYGQSNSARDALKQMGIDTSTGSWASGTDYRTAEQGYLTDKYQQQVKDMYAQQQQAQLGQLHASQQQATNKLNQQKDEYHQQTVGQKNQASVASAQGAEKLREIMSSKGLLKSGENVTANIANNTARENSLNALDQQYNNYSRDIANQIASVNDPSKEQSIIAQLGAQQAQALLNAQQTAYNQAGQEANNAWNQNFQETNNAWNQNFQQSQADQSQSNWDKSFNQQNNQFDQGMGWNYWQAQNANTQAQAQAAAQIKAYQDMIAALGGGGNFNQASGGGGTTNSPGNYQQNLAQAVKVAGIPQNQLGAFNWIIQHESSYDPNALNKSSGTYGYGQFKPFNIASYDKKMGLDYRHNPVDQLVETYQYMVDRYGSPAKAMLAWKQKGWY